MRRTTGTTTYYKVVLDKELLRNHRYVLNLNNITAPGLPRPRLR